MQEPNARPAQPARRKSPPAFLKMQEEIIRRMCAAADEILRSDWPAYAEAAKPERVTRLEQVLRDMENLAMLGKPELIAEYLDAMGEADYGGIRTPPEQGYAIAHKLIAKRREIESDVIDTADLSGIFPRAAAAPPSLAWKIISRVVVGIAVALFALFALSLALSPSPTASFGERVGAPLLLLVIDAALIFIFFFNGQARGPLWKYVTPEETLRRKMRKDVERRNSEIEKAPPDTLTRR